MKKQIRVLAALLGLFILFSFSIHPFVKHSFSSGIMNDPPAELNPKLYMLYIDNRPLPGHATTKFKKLINSLNANTKLVFQFFYTKKDSLTLIVFSGGKNHKTDFDISLEIKLTTFNKCTPTENILGEGVYLGDLEIQSEDQTDTMNSIKNAADSNFIVFFPKLNRQPNGRTTIDYTIIATNSTVLTPAELCSPTFLLTGIVGITNPSPPRKGNQ